jgi:hypothetical protein
MENTISDFELDLIETLQNSRDLSEFQIERRQLCEREDVVIIVPGSMLVTEDVLSCTIAVHTSISQVKWEVSTLPLLMV